MKRLNDYAEGERVITFCLIKNRELATASNQKEYFNLELSDQSGSLTAKLWDVTEELKTVIQVKAIVKIDATLQLYRGKKQLVIQRIRLATESDEIQHESLVQASAFPQQEMWEKLQDYLARIQSEAIRNVIVHLLDDQGLQERLRSFPAGVKMHHNYYSGLLEHIVSLLTLADRILPQYPEVDRDILYATCILHDIGKLYELSDAIAPEYSTAGQLIGHLVMGVEFVSDACRSLGISPQNTEILHLKHCILSHHGDVDLGYGSAVSGKTPTAVLFHYLDQIDSKMNALGQTMAQTEEEWEYAPVLRRKIWRGY